MFPTEILLKFEVCVLGPRQCLGSCQVVAVFVYRDQRQPIPQRLRCTLISVFISSSAWRVGLKSSGLWDRYTQAFPAATILLRSTHRGYGTKNKGLPQLFSLLQCAFSNVFAGHFLSSLPPHAQYVIQALQTDTPIHTVSDLKEPDDDNFRRVDEGFCCRDVCQSGKGDLCREHMSCVRESAYFVDLL